MISRLIDTLTPRRRCCQKRSLRSCCDWYMYSLKRMTVSVLMAFAPAVARLYCPMPAANIPRPCASSPAAVVAPQPPQPKLPYPPGNPHWPRLVEPPATVSTAPRTNTGTVLDMVMLLGSKDPGIERPAANSIVLMMTKPRGLE